MSAQLIQATTLAKQLGDPNLVRIDCRFSLADIEKGRRAFAESHIPGACYAHLEEDLSGPILKGVTGRHPLPEPEAAAEVMGRFGIDASKRVVVYDDAGGAIAARLWWMLGWLGHEAVAMLDGGWQAWLAGGFPLEPGANGPSNPRIFQAKVSEGAWLTSAEMDRWRQDPAKLLIDARGPERFRGEVEPIDPVAGHIPGALNCPFSANLAEDGFFLQPEQLAELYRDLLGERRPESVALYCGSGVTAAHNLFALERAGFKGAKLYAGSWSEWILDPNRPIALG